MDRPTVFPLETAIQGTPHVPRSTASFHLMHMIGTILLSQGFQGVQSGAMAEIERLLELHLKAQFQSAQTLANACTRSQPGLADQIESLSLAQLESLHPDLFVSPGHGHSGQSGSSGSSREGLGASEPYSHRLTRETKERRAMGAEREGTIGGYVGKSYELGVRGFGRVVGRQRGGGSQLSRLPLSITQQSELDEEPGTLSLSISPSSPSSSNPNPNPNPNANSETQPRISKRNKPSSSAHPPSLPENTFNTPLPPPQLQYPREGTPNEKPGYMGDIQWTPSLPERHRWRRTRIKEQPAPTSTERSKHLSTKTLQYLTSSLGQSGQSGSAAGGSGPNGAAGGPLAGHAHTQGEAPMELALVNHHSARPGSQLGVGTGTSSGSTSRGGMGMGMDMSGTREGESSSGCTFGLGSVSYAPSGGQGGKRRRWVIPGLSSGTATSGGTSKVPKPGRSARTTTHTNPNASTRKPPQPLGAERKRAHAVSFSEEQGGMQVDGVNKVRRVG